jgi:hypothetical protein
LCPFFRLAKALRRDPTPPQIQSRPTRILRIKGARTRQRGVSLRSEVIVVAAVTAELTANSTGRVKTISSSSFLKSFYRRSRMLRCRDAGLVNVRAATDRQIIRYVLRKPRNASRGEPANRVSTGGQRSHEEVIALFSARTQHQFRDYTFVDSEQIAWRQLHVKIGDWLPEGPVKNRVGLRTLKSSIDAEICAGSVQLAASRTNSSVRVSGGSLRNAP